jgi:beta-lactamase regulating signal transducer with metallopeptidase domain
MSAWINPGWIVQTLVASAVLMALVLVARGPVRRAFGPSVAYALWALPALRMILPPLPGWRTLSIPILYIAPHKSMIGYVDPATAVRLADAGPIVPQAVLHLPAMAPVPAPELLAAAPPPPVPGIDWSLLAVALWLGGAAIVFAVQILRYHLFLRRILADATPLSRECGIDVLVSGQLSGPIAAGIWRRRILLPIDFVRRYTSAERRLALKHEAAHHDRRDIVANLAASAVVALHWWNPLAHRAYRAFRADQELACDATVLADAPAGDRHTYGTAMLKSASGHMPAMACALSHKDQLKQRIMMMAKSPIGRLRLGAGAALTTAAVAGGLLLTASGAARAVDPVAPVPPVPPVASLPTVPTVPTVSTTPVVVSDDRHSHHNDRHYLTAADERRIREDARQAARDSRMAAAEAQRATMEGQREAMAAQRDALAAVRAGAEEARRGAADARFAIPPVPPIPDVRAIVKVSLDRTRAGMAAQCAAEGNPVPASADFDVLATCGVKKMIISSLRLARESIRRDRKLTPDKRAHALAGLDRAIAANERHVADD